MRHRPRWRARSRPVARARLRSAPRHDVGAGRAVGTISLWGHGRRRTPAAGPPACRHARRRRSRGRVRVEHDAGRVGRDPGSAGAGPRRKLRGCQAGPRPAERACPAGAPPGRARRPLAAPREHPGEHGRPDPMARRGADRPPGRVNRPALARPGRAAGPAGLPGAPRRRSRRCAFAAASGALAGHGGVQGVLEPPPSRMDSNAPSVHPQQALAVYAESLVAGARVAVFGDASLGLGSRLVELGARSVQVWDPEPSRARTEADQSPRGVSVHPYAESESDTRGFDLALVIDLGQFADPAAVLRRVRRVVGIDGVAMIAARSAEVAQPEGSRAFDYYDLFDLVAPEFESVRMVAQLPFHGIALVELGEEDESPAVNVDPRLAESGRGPEAFVVVASQRGARLEPYSIVQLPSDTRGHVVNDAADLEALARAELRAELLASQLDDLRARMAEGERAADETSILEETLRVRSARVAELEKALAARGRDLADLSSEVEEMRAAAEAGRIAAAQVEEVALRADRAERRVASLESALNSLSQEVARSGDVHSVELARVEEGLRERAQALRLLEGELARREQIVRDLVG